MSKLEELLRNRSLMDYLKENDLHDWGCNSWSEGQWCCLELNKIQDVLLGLLEESGG